VSQAVFTLDLNRCTGCAACSIACRIENDVGEGIGWRGIHTFNAAKVPSAGVFHYTLACNHCAEPACMYGCPASAYTKDPNTGAVLLNADHCIGCRYCTWVCPYGAPQFNRSTGLMEKCTFCSHRLEVGQEPACAAACPVDALGFERDGEPGEIDHPGFPAVGLQPGLQLTPKRAGSAPPVMTGVAMMEALPSPRPSASGSKLREEWPLLAFTFTAALLVAWLTAATAGGIPFHLVAFVVAGVAATAISTAHLGRPARAWRAVLNVRRSWVSREIVLWSAFLAAACAAALPGAELAALHWPAVALGFSALFCIDMVYRVRGQTITAVPHSAMTTLTAVFLIGLLLRDPFLALSAGGLKLGLYLARWMRTGGMPPWLGAVRLGAGFLWPAAVWVWAPETPLALLLAGPLAGELVDRARFYAELDFLGPARQIERDLRRVSAAAEPAAVRLPSAAPDVPAV